MRLLRVLAGLAALVALAGCGQAPPPAPAAPATPSPTAVPIAPVAARGPVITAFTLIDEVDCAGALATVPVAWATNDTRQVEFQVDRSPLGPARPASGIGSVAVPCDGREHAVVLVAIGSDTRVSLARHVNTSNAPPPPATPSVAGFDLLDEVTCTGPTVEVAAGWATRNAQAVSFAVDGQPLPAGAGFPVTGAGDVQVPCDGATHKVTLTATGTGAPASLSRSVNTSTTPPPPPAGAPVVTSFQVIDDVTCSGSTVSVPASWATQNAQTVTFQVDGQAVGAGAGYPVSGAGKVAVPCDGREHQLLLVAAGPGGQVSKARHVNTTDQPPPPTAASISRYDLLEDVTCSGGVVGVPAKWTTQNAQAVNFAVDGQPVSAGAGFPTSGSGTVQVPCDGSTHKVTLTASGAGDPASRSRSVNTTVVTPDPTTPPVAPTTTDEAPTTPDQPDPTDTSGG